MRSLLKEQAAIDSQLKQAQKYKGKLTKRLQKKQSTQNNEPGNEASASITQHKEKIAKLIRIKAQLREKLSTIKLKLAELKRKQII